MKAKREKAPAGLHPRRSGFMALPIIGSAWLVIVLVSFVMKHRWVRELERSGKFPNVTS